MQTNDHDGAPAGEAEHQSATDANATKHGAVTLTDDDEDSVAADDSEHRKDGGEPSDGADEEVAEDDAKARRPGRRRNQRYRDRIAALRAELEAERRQPRPPVRDSAGASGQRSTGARDDDDLVEPRQADFPNDDRAYDRALRDFQIRRALRDERRRDLELQARADAAAEFRDKVSGYNTRLETLKSRIPDFDETLRAAAGTEIRDDVRDLILGSAKGPLLAYYLAKHPDALDDINRMPPHEAARRIGNLEARVRGPSPATATNANVPVAPLRGGASAPRALDPTRMSHAEYRKARAEGRI
jgi:hypothetical protein